MKTTSLLFTQFERSKKRLIKLADGKYCSLSIDFNNFASGGQLNTQLYIEEIGCTNTYKSYGPAFKEMEEKVRIFNNTDK